MTLKLNLRAWAAIVAITCAGSACGQADAPKPDNQPPLGAPKVAGTRPATTRLAAGTKPTTAVAAAATTPATTQAVKKDQSVPPTGKEDEFYKIVSIPVPPEITLECSALELMPDGKLVVGTRRGDIYLVENAYTDPADKVRFTRWASGLHEIMGLAQRDGWVYASQRGEITRLKDTRGSGRADVYENFYDGWGIKGDYHEYPLMSRFDKDGNLYVALCLTGSVKSESPFRGWFFKITPDGKGIPFACGVRSPGGVGFDHEGHIFFTDNQGFWNGTDGLKLVTYGSFQGNPTGNIWYDDAIKLNPDFGPRPIVPNTPSRITSELKRVPTFVPPPILLPYRKMGQSTSGILCDLSDGKFGPFNHQLFIADQSHSNVARGAIEKVNGTYQGWCTPFRRGFGSGIVPMVQAGDGSWFVGGTNRGWSSMGPRPFALERLVWTGKTPFEMLDMKVRPDGFELSFTRPVDKKTAADPASYNLSAYGYIYQSGYGSPEVDPTTPTITAAVPSDDGLRVKLTVDGLVAGHVHELHMAGLRDTGGKPVLHPVAYYTMWNIPTAAPGSTR